MSIPEYHYHDAAYGEPLVAELVWRVAGRCPAGSRVLVIGPSAHLAQALIELGLEVHLWRWGESFLPDELQGAVKGTLTPEQLLEGPPLHGTRFSAIVLPRVLEHVRANPGVVLRGLAPFLDAGGCIVLATTNLGRLGTRARALLGCPAGRPGFSPSRSATASVTAPSGTPYRSPWPAIWARS
jgi:hypothetical protein